LGGTGVGAITGGGGVSALAVTVGAGVVAGGVADFGLAAGAVAGALVLAGAAGSAAGDGEAPDDASGDSPCPAALAAGFAAVPSAAVVAGFDLASSPVPWSRPCRHAMKPSALLEQVVATGPTMIAAMTRRLKTAAAIVTASGLVGAGSASSSSSSAAESQPRASSGES
jgi:hypothetical protein